jgi:hypothetical protein
VESREDVSGLLGRRVELHEEPMSATDVRRNGLLALRGEALKRRLSGRGFPPSGFLSCISESLHGSDSEDSCVGVVASTVFILIHLVAIRILRSELIETRYL